MADNLVKVLVHCVWATWDRLPLITPEAERGLARCMEDACLHQGCELLAIGNMPDHVHLLIALSHTVTISDFVKHVKGASSYAMSRTIIPGEWFQWQGGYAAFSVSPRHKEAVIAYIHHQKQHHADRTLWREVEQTPRDLSLSAKAD